MQSSCENHPLAPVPSQLTPFQLQEKKQTADTSHLTKHHLTRYLERNVEYVQLSANDLTDLKPPACKGAGGRGEALKFENSSPCEGFFKTPMYVCMLSLYVCMLNLYVCMLSMYVCMFGHLEVHSPSQI